MEVLYARCCGLDVHRSKVVACVSIIEAGHRRKETRTFGTTTRELLLLRQWLVGWPAILNWSSSTLSI